MSSVKMWRSLQIYKISLGCDFEVPNTVAFSCLILRKCTLPLCSHADFTLWSIKKLLLKVLGKILPKFYQNFSALFSV